VVQVVIEDTGEGIREDQLAHVFDPFFTTREPNEGVGLRLTIARAVVEQHGGRISIESRPATGTRVRPRCREGERAMEETHRIRILIIEDDPTHATIMRKRLEEADPGYQVQVAYSGEEGVENLRKGKYALVLLDYNLPDGDGLSILDRLRAIDRGVPIILVTVEDSASVAVKAMKRGATDYIIKDKDYHNFVQHLQRIWAL